MDAYTKKFCTTTLLIVGVLALDRVPAVLARTPHMHRVAAALDDIHQTRLNARDFHALAAGYYEGLRTDAGIAGVWEREDVQEVPFLRYELKPNLHRPYKAGMRITNSLGVASPEYPYQKPPHTRRIALLGDSLSLGPFGYDYAALLEKSLNEKYTSADVQRFELLNFAVYGYSTVQMMDVALHKAPLFQPDVYIVALTNLEIMPKAGSRTHLARLAASGADLKYDFLRKILAESGSKPKDSLTDIYGRLGPYLDPLMRLPLEQIRDNASAAGAPTVVILVPIPIETELITADFKRIRAMIGSLGLPIVDLGDTFQSVQLDSVKVDPKLDSHPNRLGHAMIFENLSRKLQAQPGALAALTGTASTAGQPAGIR